MNENLVPFVEKIERMSVPTIHEIEGKSYSSKQLNLVKQPLADKLQVFSLDSIVDYIDFIKKDGVEPDDVIINVESYKSVKLLSKLNSLRDRECLIHASVENPQIIIGQYLPAEEFNIMIQSQFADAFQEGPLNDKAKVLEITSVVSDSIVREQKDDGVSQQLSAKSGIVSKEWKEVPNPVTLMPLITFPEIQPPSVKYILRAKKSESGIMLALFNASGKLAEYETIAKIKGYLAVKITEENHTEVV